MFTLFRIAFAHAPKIVAKRASVHTQERFCRRDFCDRAKLRRAVAFGWLSERSGEKTLCPITF